jgi:hypothetical protein
MNSDQKTGAVLLVIAMLCGAVMSVVAVTLGVSHGWRLPESSAAALYPWLNAFFIMQTIGILMLAAGSRKK